MEGVGGQFLPLIFGSFLFLKEESATFALRLVAYGSCVRHQLANPRQTAVSLFSSFPPCIAGLSSLGAQDGPLRCFQGGESTAAFRLAERKVRFCLRVPPACPYLRSTFPSSHLSLGLGCSAGCPMAMTLKGTMCAGRERASFIAAMVRATG